MNEGGMKVLLLFSGVLAPLSLRNSLLGRNVLVSSSAEETRAHAHAGFGQDGKAYFWIGEGALTSGRRTLRLLRNADVMSRRPIARLSEQAVGTTVHQVPGPTIAPTISARLSSILLATTSKRSVTNLSRLI
jgi:hypothetical protein